MQEMLKALVLLQECFDVNARLTKAGDIKINRQELNSTNVMWLSDFTSGWDLSVTIKRSGTGLVLIFKSLT